MRQFKIDVQIGQRKYVFQDRHIRPALRVGISVFLGGAAALAVTKYVQLDLWQTVGLLILAALVIFWCGMRFGREKRKRKRVQQTDETKEVGLVPMRSREIRKDERWA